MEARRYHPDGVGEASFSSSSSASFSSSSSSHRHRRSHGDAHTDAPLTSPQSHDSSNLTKVSAAILDGDGEDNNNNSSHNNNNSAEAKQCQAPHTTQSISSSSSFSSSFSSSSPSSPASQPVPVSLPPLHAQPSTVSESSVRTLVLFSASKGAFLSEPSSYSSLLSKQDSEYSVRSPRHGLAVVRTEEDGKGRGAVGGGGEGGEERKKSENSQSDGTNAVSACTSPGLSNHSNPDQMVKFKIVCASDCLLRPITAQDVLEFEQRCPEGALRLHKLVAESTADRLDEVLFYFVQNSFEFEC
ncbi:MAG TPA: hypothetical protein V6C97_08180 [Oculatellaceae cyanobacterium]